jgi:predicted transcriptional regulator
MSPYDVYDTDNAPALPEAPAFIEAVKSCNTFRIVATKARIQIKKLMREKKAIFSDQVAQHIQAIKAIRKAETTSIKSSDVFKAYNKAQNAYSRSFTRTLKDFNINTFPLRRQLRLRLKDDCRMWQYSGARMVSRLFRLRL